MIRRSWGKNNAYQIQMDTVSGGRFDLRFHGGEPAGRPCGIASADAAQLCAGIPLSRNRQFQTALSVSADAANDTPGPSCESAATLCPGAPGSRLADTGELSAHCADAPAPPPAALWLSWSGAAVARVFAAASREIWHASHAPRSECLSYAPPCRQVGVSAPATVSRPKGLPADCTGGVSPDGQAGPLGWNEADALYGLSRFPAIPASGYAGATGAAVAICRPLPALFRVAGGAAGLSLSIHTTPHGASR